MSAPNESIQSSAFTGEEAAGLEEQRRHDDRAGIRQELDRMRMLLEDGEQHMNKVLKKRVPGSERSRLPVSIRARAMAITRGLQQGRRPKENPLIRTSSVFRKGSLRIDYKAGGSFLITNTGMSTVYMQGWKIVFTMGHRKVVRPFPARAFLLPREIMTASFPTVDRHLLEPNSEVNIDLLNHNGKLVANHAVESEEDDLQDRVARVALRFEDDAAAHPSACSVM